MCYEHLKEPVNSTAAKTIETKADRTIKKYERKENRRTKK